MKRTLLPLLASLAFSVAARGDHNPAHARTLVLKDKEGNAILGYDPVAYFTDGRAMKGDPRHRSQQGGAHYNFVSAGHKALFDANPAKYLPAYGGYCGYAASVNRLSPISPEWFQILDGRLILQHDKRAFDKFNADLKGNAMKADANWPGLVEKNGVAGGKSLVLVDKSGVAIEGYDPVSYFVGGSPQKGNPALSATFDGALYHFASPEHRGAFEKNPVKYAPAYGGYCGYAASIGKVRPADPLLWSVVDGQLILQHTKGAAELWARDVRGNKAKADRLWPRLVEVKAGVKDPIDGLLSRSVLPDLN